MSFDFGGSFSEATDVASEVEINPDVYDYGDEQLTSNLDNPGESVNNFSGNSDFVNATNPGSIVNDPTAIEGYGVNEVGATPLNPGATEIEGYGVNEIGASPPPSTLETLQAKAGDALNSVQDAIKKQLDQITPEKISKAVEGYAKQLVVQTAKQVIATQLPPALQPYATRTLNTALSSTSAKPVSSSTNPQSPNFVGPPAPTATAPTPTNAGPSFQQFDDGSSIQTFEDGSTLTIDSAGKATSTPAPADPPVPTTQTFDDGSTLTTAADGKVTSTPAPADDPQSTARSLANAANQIVKANSPGTVNDPGLATPPLSTAEALAAAASLIPGGTAVTQTIADAAARAQGLLRQAQNQQTARVQSNNNAATGDWRVRLQLAPASNYLYNAPDCGPLLWPLRDTDGVIFPYTPAIDLGYKANYTQYDLTHSNYRGYFYQNSYIDQVNVKATFTAQDTAEANYLLACIHFFRSVTKMFYGQDAERGAPPPLVFLSGLGDFQFNKHPCVVSQFNYNLPADVNYIRAQSTLSNGGNQLAARTRQTTLGNPIASTIQRLSSLGQKIFPGAVTAPFAPQGSLAAGNPTYVPTKMELSLTLLPIQTRSQVSQQFSVRGFANGNLLKGGFW
jgi:hypothetical protein